MQYTNEIILIFQDLQQLACQKLCKKLGHLRLPFVELHIVGAVAQIRGNLANWFLTQMNHMYVVPVSALQGKEFHQYPRYMYKQGTTRVTHRAAGDHNSYTPCCRGPQ